MLSQSQPHTIKYHAKPENEQNFTQITSKAKQKIILYSESFDGFIFPLVCDHDVGIPDTYQHMVIKSVSMTSFSTTMTTGRQPARSCNKEWLKPWTIYMTFYSTISIPQPVLTTRNSSITNLKRDYSCFSCTKPFELSPPIRQRNSINTIKNGA